MENISGSWKDIVIPLQWITTEETSNLWEEMWKIPFQLVDSPFLELPGVTVVPGATPVVPETQRNYGHHRIMFLF